MKKAISELLYCGPFTSRTCVRRRSQPVTGGATVSVLCRSTLVGESASVTGPARSAETASVNSRDLPDCFGGLLAFVKLRVFIGAFAFFLLVPILGAFGAGFMKEFRLSGGLVATFFSMTTTGGELSLRMGNRAATEITGLT